MENAFTDLQSAKIDLLKQGFNDAVSTIRAYENKIRLLQTISFTILGIFGALYMQFIIDGSAHHEVPRQIYYQLTVFFLVSAGWFLAIRNLMLASRPRSIGSSIFVSDNFTHQSDLFYISTSIEKDASITDKINIRQLVEKLEALDSYEKLVELWYEEIGTISYIRDVKSFYLDKAYRYIWFNMLFTVVNLMIILLPQHVQTIAVTDVLLFCAFLYYTERQPKSS